VGGHKQFTIIKSLALCAQKQEVNETFGFKTERMESPSERH